MSNVRVATMLLLRLSPLLLAISGAVHVRGAHVHGGAVVQRDQPGPLIGVFPCDNTSANLVAYQRWVEQYGARTLVLPAEAGDREAERIFQSINGLLLPGMMYTRPPNATEGRGRGRGRGVPQLVQQLVRRAIVANREEGDFFPLWGTCLGFEWIVELVGGDGAVASGYNSTDFAQALAFSAGAPGRMFAAANASLQRWLATERITYNDHSRGVQPREISTNPPLRDTFRVLASSADRQGKPFVAAVEGGELPLYGTQFHPEHVQFVRGSGIPRSPEAVAAARYLAQFFVSEAAKNQHVATTATE